MANYDELIHISAAAEVESLAQQPPKSKNFLDYFALAVTTFGVGYIPIAPGTWGSAVGVLIYVLFEWATLKADAHFSVGGISSSQIAAWNHAVIMILFLAFCLLGIWASSRATRLFKNKDPQKVVVDEVIGQLIIFLFIPFTTSWVFILAGFLLFRLFDIWKPYPIDSLQNLPTGIGVCADDILAGVYGGTILALIYAISFSF
jgi:phosphatidylglycerophosphatase A